MTPAQFKRIREDLHLSHKVYESKCALAALLGKDSERTIYAYENGTLPITDKVAKRMLELKETYSDDRVRVVNDLREALIKEDKVICLEDVKLYNLTFYNSLKDCIIALCNHETKEFTN